MYHCSIKLYLMPLSFALTDGLGSMLHEEGYLGHIHCFQQGQFWSSYALHLHLLIGFFHKPPDSLGETKGHVLELHNFLFPEQSLSINHLDAFLLVICQRGRPFSLTHCQEGLRLQWDFLYFTQTIYFIRVHWVKSQLIFKACLKGIAASRI